MSFLLEVQKNENSPKLSRKLSRDLWREWIHDSVIFPAWDALGTRGLALAPWQWCWRAWLVQWEAGREKGRRGTLGQPAGHCLPLLDEKAVTRWCKQNRGTMVGADLKDSCSRWGWSAGIPGPAGPQSAISTLWCWCQGSGFWAYKSEKWCLWQVAFSG